MAKKIFHKGWTSVPNTIINNNQLSAKAKCLWVYINSKPDKWDFSISGTCIQMKEGREAVRKACQELEDWGLLTRKQNNNQGLFGSSEWILSDIPYDTITDARKPDARKPDARKPDVGKSTTSNKELSKTKESNKDIDTKEVLDYLNMKLGTKYRQAKGLSTRFSEGYTVEDAKKVIDIKFADWIGDEKMKQYIRPATLFSDKFDTYLNQEMKIEQPKSHDFGILN